MDIVTYILCKKLISSVASGISNVELVGKDLIFTTPTGEQFSVTLPLPEESVSVVSIDVDEENRAILYTMSDGSVVNAGSIPACEGGGEITEEQIEEITQNVYNLFQDQYPDATEEDIDALFGPRSPDEYATKDDIDALFPEE